MFSGSVMLGSLDDFITPSQACVNPLFTGSTSSGTGSDRLPPTAGKSASGTPGVAGTPTPAAAKISIVSDFDSFEISSGNRPDLIKPVRNSKGAISLSLDDGGETDCKVDTRSTARVTLNDCLACSGCVTSAETVLIQQQSASEFQAAVSRTTTSAVLISFAPQALASLAAHMGLQNTAEAYQRLTTFFRWQVQDWSAGREQPLPVLVCDTVLASDLILHEAGREFMHRVSTAASEAATTTTAAAAQGTPDIDVGASGSRSVPSFGGLAPPSRWVAPQPSIAVSALAQRKVGHMGAVLPEEAVPRLAGPASSTTGGSVSLPVLTSACPGWVCYAEKTVPESLPYVSTLKSPQQVTGALAKLMLAKGGVLQPAPHDSEQRTVLGPIHPAGVYHVAIMPCYDRKLEASRRDFWWEKEGLLGYVGDTAGGAAAAEGGSWKEVDCVLSSLEVAELLQKHAQGLVSQASTLGQVHNGTTAAVLSSQQLKDVYPPAQRVGLVYSHTGQDSVTADSQQAYTRPSLPGTAHGTEGALDVEALLCALKTVHCASLTCASSQMLAGASVHHVESDGYAIHILRYTAGQLREVAAALRQALHQDIERAGGSAGVDTQASDSWLQELLSPTSLESVLPSSLLDPTCPLPVTTGRNSDMREYTLKAPLPLLLAWHAQQQHDTSKGSVPTMLQRLQDLHPSLRFVVVPLGFAWAYGFRNIQGIVNKLKRAGGRGPLAALPSTSASAKSVSQLPSASFPYAYVEVMACPGGCTNGGGQVRVVEGERQEEGAGDRAGTAAASAGTGVELDLEAQLSALNGKTKPVNALKAAADAAKARLALVAQLNAGQQHGCSSGCKDGASCASPAAATNRLSSPAQTEEGLLRLVPWLRHDTGGPVPVPVPVLRPHPQLWSHLLHTQYHAVPPLVEGAGGGFSGSALKW